MTYSEKINSYFYIDDKVIFGLFREYRFLSNFHICRVVYEGIEFTSSEAAYQSAKCLNQMDRLPFATMTPRQAKDAGQKVNIKPSWKDIKLKVMLDVLYSKFSLNEDIRRALLNTGDRSIHEANHWDDKFWGIDYKTFEGDDWLGKILMALRKTFKTINNPPQ